jgi:CubicO group peptidase (beta-lactamase class C family)
MKTMLRPVLLAAILLSGPAYCPAAAAQDTPQVWPTKEWQASSPEQQGMDSRALASLVDFGAARGMDSLLVTRHGKIVTEAYYAPFRPGIRHRMNSATKAVIGTLIAIALKNGSLDSLNHRVSDFFSDRAIASFDEKKQAITIQNLLDMTSGLDWVEGLESGRAESLFAMERSPDWQQFVLDRPMAQPPGAGFYYNSGNAHLLSAILSKITGAGALDYAKQQLFGPLGITDVFWRRDPQGISAGGAGLYLQPRDMAKIGYLYLRNGAWEGKQLLPTDWIEKVNHASIDMNLSWAPDFRYTNLFWALPDRNVYIAAGYYRQLIIVMPALDIVAVATGTRSYPYHELLDAIAGGVKSDEALPPDPGALALLASRVDDVVAEKPTPVGKAPALAGLVSRKVYRFTDNALHLEWLSLNLTGANPTYEYRYTTDAPGERFRGPIGLDGLYQIGGRRRFGVNAAKGTWLDERTFVIDAQTLGNADAVEITLKFEGRGIDLSVEEADGFRSAAHGETTD